MKHCFMIPLYNEVRGPCFQCVVDLDSWHRKQTASSY